MGLIFFAVFAIVMAVIASKKGFNPAFWLLAGGVIGLVALIAMPSAGAEDIDEAVRLERRKRANVVGGVISGLAIVLIVVMLTIRM